MTAPALLVLAGGARNDASALILQRLKLKLHELRDNLHCQVAFVGPGQPSVTAAARTLAKQGHEEIVCVPLECARLAAPSSAATSAVARLRAELPDLVITLADTLGAPGALFTLLDQRLRDALVRSQSRELDALTLVHDGTDDATDTALLARRARLWSAHHKLPVTVAGLRHGQTPAQAVAAHTDSGRRHVAVAWLSVFDDAAVRQGLDADPRVAGVAAPLGADAAVAESVVATYSVAALRSLDADVAAAS